MQIHWEENTRKKYEQMIAKIPLVLRGVAQANVLKEVERIVASEKRDMVTEKDMVDAFFKATPFGFHGPMKTDMESMQIDYSKFGYPK